MQYRTDPKTGHSLSALGFGCMRFPKSFEATEELVVRAIESGVNYFDTAYIYNGSEETLGKILHKNGLRDKVYLATKLPLFLCKSTADFDKYFQRQLERLQTDHIDYYFMHMLTDPGSWQRLCDLGIEQWAENKKRSGQIRQFGFSFHGSRADFLALLDVYPWDFCMIQYNYMDENYQAGQAGLQAASAKGLPVFVMEPLLGGRLASGLPAAARELFESVNGESNAWWAFRWLWNQPEVTVVLSGMNALDVLAENVRTAETAYPNTLTQSELEVLRRVAEVFNQTDKIHCTGCNYCMPCPRHVNIPACFAAYNTSYSMGRMAGFQQYMTSTGVMSGERANAGLCVRCGKCERHCPQKIQIIHSLARVRRRMEPWWFRTGIWTARKALGVKKK